MLLKLHMQDKSYIQSPKVCHYQNIKHQKINWTKRRESHLGFVFFSLKNPPNPSFKIITRATTYEAPLFNIWHGTQCTVLH